MKRLIDARGMLCPLPVIETKKVLREIKEGLVEVLVDNEIAVQNLSKMATELKIIHSSEKISDDHYVVRMELSGNPSGHQSEHTSQKNQIQANVPQKDSNIIIKDINSVENEDDARKETCVVVISADHMGEGDEQLGKTLMKGFIYALTELDQLPDKIIHYHGGAKLTVEGSDSLEDLKLLESQGVEILTCGACLNFYGITDQLLVGSVTNMYTIAEIMMSATKIIKP